MKKGQARSLMGFYAMQATNHQSKCACNKTMQGAMKEHGGLDDEEIAAIIALASEEGHDPSPAPTSPTSVWGRIAAWLLNN